MFDLVFLIPLFPLAGCAILILAGASMPRRLAGGIAAGSTALSAGICLAILIRFAQSPPEGHSYSQTLWIWMQVGSFNSSISFYLDALSLTMASVVCFVGLLILLYSIAFMADDPSFSRFFAYMNLFIGAMLILLLAEDLLLLYLGWEGVGLCSYLLIGFWYREKRNAAAAIKAFLVTRIGDTAMAVGLFYLIAHFGTLNIPALMQKISACPTGSILCVVPAALLLCGAVGKSAQLPLQTWLPDAMAGPTPVSALIHAATMVTAGVYLIARTHLIYVKAPAVMSLVADIGAITLLLAACSASVQTDIKRILAYSTISQIGYMFLGLGVGAWSGAIYHFITHAFFKAALFLGAGVLMVSLEDEHDIFKMGGLRKLLPKTFYLFAAGILTLAAIPPLSVTFNSKDAILNAVWLKDNSGGWLWGLAVTGALLTAFYAARLFFVVFFGQPNTLPAKKTHTIMIYTFGILALLGFIAGWPELLKAAGGNENLDDFLHNCLPASQKGLGPGQIWLFQLVYTLISLIGIFSAYILYVHRRSELSQIRRHPLFIVLHNLLFAGWGFDWFYDRLLVRPYRWIAQVNRDDFFDLFPRGVIESATVYNRLLVGTITGNVRWYVGAVVIGSIILIAFMVML
jgi:NADH-quinone oxidoreductase subunit L